jgi:hypothetical protein
MSVRKAARRSGRTRSTAGAEAHFLTFFGGSPDHGQFHMVYAIDWDFALRGPTVSE